MCVSITYILCTIIIANRIKCFSLLVCLFFKQEIFPKSANVDVSYLYFHLVSSYLRFITFIYVISFCLIIIVV